MVGAGGFGRAVAEAVQLGERYRVVGFVDDRWPGVAEVGAYPVLGSLDQLESLRAQAQAAIVAIGDNRVRRHAFELARRAGFEIAIVIHPQALVSPSARLCPGVIVMAGANVGCAARVGDGAIINAGAVLDHDVQIGAFAHIGIRACVGGGGVVDEGAFLKIGAVVGGAQHIAANAVVGSTLA